MSDFKVSRGTLGRHKIGDDDFIWTQLENENDAERVCELVNGLNAEITRLRSELERVRGQRDELAVALHSNECSNAGYGMCMTEDIRAEAGESANRTLACFGLRIVNGKVEEIEG